MKFQICYQCQ